VTLAVALSERSLVTMLRQQRHKGGQDERRHRHLTDPNPGLRDRDTAGHAARDHEPTRSWSWTLVAALAYAGASIDPTAAMAAQRLARIRDEELGRSRW
jgi:hypothetical protein